MLLSLLFYIYNLTFKDFIFGFLFINYSIYNNQDSPVTLNFPEEKNKLSKRFRGIHMLCRYSSGEERCIACKLCEVICPALAITIVSDTTYIMSRKTKKYDIDLTKCIYCGLCQEACPVDAIIESQKYNHIKRKHDELLYNKFELLKNYDSYVMNK